MKAKANQNAKSANDGHAANNHARDNPVLPGCISFLEETSLLDEEDEDSYQDVFKTVLNETGAQSFLSRVAAKDYADKLFEERRCKSAIAELMEAARSCSWSPTKDGQKLDAIEKYLPLLVKFDRIINGSQAGRRALLKELRQSLADANNSGLRPARTTD